MTTKLVVDAGICGNTTTIDVVGLPSHKVTVTVTSDCEVVSKMGEELKELDWRPLEAAGGWLFRLQSCVTEYQTFYVPRSCGCSQSN